MIDKLTNKQKALKKEIRDKWINQLTAPINKEKIREVVEYIYKISKLDKPKVVILKSPLACQYGANMVDRQEVGQEVRQEVRRDVWEGVWQEVEQEVRQEVEQEVGQEVRQEVWQEVGREVRQEVWQEVEQDKKIKFYQFGHYLSSWCYDWFSFYDFFERIGVIKNEKFNKLREGVEAGIYETIQLKGICFVSTSPEYVRRNEEKKLHSDQSPAIRWSDGYEIYALDGVRLPKNLWTKIISKEMTLSEIMKIEISDQRTVALKYNPQAIIKENAKLVHKDNRNNELYLVENSEINKLTNFPKMYFLKMLCPTGRIFIEGVEPKFAEEHPNATECQAELCGLVLSEYQMMTLES
jgi:hypothetical protein